MIEIILILATLGVDQLTKMWAAGSLAAMEGGIFDLVPGVFRLRYVENRGAAFGMLQGQAWLFYILTAVAVVGIGYVLLFKRRKMSRLMCIAFALLLSGAVGNFIDRVALGYVRDMFDFYLINFAVFNVADMCITIGAALLILAVFLEERAEKKAKAAAADGERGASASLEDEGSGRTLSPDGKAAPEESGGSSKED